MRINLSFTLALSLTTACVLVSGTSLPSQAADEAAVKEEAAAAALGNATAKDANNYLGDRVVFIRNVLPTAHVKVEDGAQTLQDACIPAGFALRGAGKTADAILFTAINDGQSCDATEHTIKAGATITVPLAVLADNIPDRYGLAYGALVVPFKFQLTRDHQFTGSATVGPYLGYRIDRTTSGGWALTGAMFAGASNISAADTMTDANGTTSVSTKQLAGFSYGVGLLGTVQGSFQLGVVLGFDSVGGGTSFKYNNMPWLAFELGYSFSQ